VSKVEINGDIFAGKRVNFFGLGRRHAVSVTLVALAAALSSGCSSSHGKGKIATEIRNLPNGLVADTAHASHTDSTLQNVDNTAEGQ